MVELLKKAAFTGIGLAFATKEAIEESGRKLIKEANLSEEEGKKFVAELLRKSSDARIAFEKVVHDSVGAVLKKIDVPTREEVDGITRRIDTLEEKSS